LDDSAKVLSQKLLFIPLIEIRKPQMHLEAVAMRLYLWLLFFSLLTAAVANPVQGSFSYAGKDVPVTMYFPQNYKKGQSPPLMVTLPPGPGNADMVKANLSNYWLQEGLRRGYVIVAPEIFGRDLERGANQFTEALFRWVSARATYDRRSVALTGQSNGGIGAFYLAVAQPHRFTAMLVLPGQYLGEPKNLSKLRGKRILMLVGEKDDPDRWLSPVESTAKALQKYSAKVDLQVLPGQGHVPRLNPTSLYDWLEK
jgi:predicted esterase